MPNRFQKLSAAIPPYSPNEPLIESQRLELHSIPVAPPLLGGGKATDADKENLGLLEPEKGRVQGACEWTEVPEVFAGGRGGLLQADRKRHQDRHVDHDRHRRDQFRCRSRQETRTARPRREEC